MDKEDLEEANKHLNREDIRKLAGLFGKIALDFEQLEYQANHTGFIEDMKKGKLTVKENLEKNPICKSIGYAMQKEYNESKNKSNF